MKSRKTACPSCGAPVEFTVGSMVSASPKAVPNISPRASSCACSLAVSIEVFRAAMVAPDPPHERGLNSGCHSQSRLPVWCSGYHEALSMPRPGFDSRHGRLFSLNLVRFRSPTYYTMDLNAIFFGYHP